MRRITLLFIPYIALAQEEIYREEQPTRVQVSAEVFGASTLIGTPINDLSGLSAQGTGDLLNILRARAGVSVTFANKFTLGIAGIYVGEAASEFQRLPIGFSEAYVQLDTFVLPIGGLGELRMGRQIINYGMGLSFGDYHGLGTNAIRFAYRFSPAWDWYLHVLYAKSNEGGARQVEYFWYPFAYYDPATNQQAFKWIYTKYDIETWALILGKSRGDRGIYDFFIYGAAMTEDRGFVGGFNPYWLGGYINIGPIGNFSMEGEVGYMTGRWGSRQEVCYDFCDQIYDITGGEGQDISAYAIGIRGSYDFTDQITGGLSFFAFSGDNPNTRGLYESWLSPIPRSGVSAFSPWTHWTGMGEVFIWNYRPDNWRSIYFFNPTNFVVVNLNFIYKAFPIQQSLIVRLDGFMFAEASSPSGVDSYLGSEFDMALKFSYADIADVGITFGYFVPSARLQNTGWSRPSRLNLWLAGLVPDYQVLRISGSSYVVRLWIYRSINIF